MPVRYVSPERPAAPAILMLAGVVAPILYIVAVVIGGLLRPRYSHLDDAISVLIAEGAPHKVLLGGLFFAYNVLAIFAADALAARLRLTESRPLRWAGATFLTTAILGMLLLAVPMDRPNAPMTPIGVGHAILAGLVALGCLATVALTAFGAAKLGYGTYATFAWRTFAVMLVAGAVAAAAAALHWPWMGLAERISVGAYLVWMARTCWQAITNHFPRFAER